MKLRIKDFSLRHTLGCGQFFRYEKIGEWYYIIIKDNIIKIKQENNDLIYYSNKNINNNFIINFFRLDDNYDFILKDINKDKIIDKAIKKYYGLRLMRQDPWECLLSFVCSSASNIPRIKKDINNIAVCYGKRVGFDNKIFYCLEKNKIKNINELDSCGLGFRCDYIKKLFSKNINFNEIKKMNYNSAKAELMKLDGVGEKIADCVLLFSLDFQNAFPADTWMRKIMIKYYFNNKKNNNKELVKKAQEYFGDYAGYAQQFLYAARKDF